MMQRQHMWHYVPGLEHGLSRIPSRVQEATVHGDVCACACVCVHIHEHTLRRVIKTDARSPQSLLLHGWRGGGAKPKEPLAAEPSKHQGNGV